MKIRILASLLAAFAMFGATGAAAQDAGAADTGGAAPDIGDTVFDGDWVSIGIGAAYSPSYDGSDDYVVSVLPIVQGSLGGVDINPRPGGLAFDFVPDAEEGPGFDFGVATRIRRNRASRIEDPVVASLGELDTAFEIGPTVGVSFPGILSPYDSLSFDLDARWDIAGAYGGMVVDPSVTYFTPLSRGAFASLSLGAEYADSDYADYYYSVGPADSQTSGLPQFDAASGFTKASATILLGVDLDGDATNGGLALTGIGSYSRMLGDARRTPFTSIRGDANQWFLAVGMGYTF